MPRNTAFNQRRRGGNRRNRRSINQHRAPVVFVTDTRHQFSAHNDEGVLVLSRHKRAPPTAEQLETEKQKKVTIKKKQLDRSNLSHKVIALHECGCYMPTEFQFLPKKSVGSSLFCRQSLRSIGKRRQQHRSFFRALNTTKKFRHPVFRDSSGLQGREPQITKTQKCRV